MYSESLVTGVIVYIFEAISAKEFFNKNAAISALEATAAVAAGDLLYRLVGLPRAYDQAGTSIIAGLIYGAERMFFNKPATKKSPQVPKLEGLEELGLEVVPAPTKAVKSESYWKNTGYVFIIALIAKMINRPMWSQLNVMLKLNKDNSIQNSLQGILSGVNPVPIPPPNNLYPNSGMQIPQYVTGNNDEYLPLSTVTPNAFNYCGC